MISVDLFVKDILTEELALVKERPNLVDNIFRGLSAVARAQIKTYVAEAVIDIRLGWTQATTRLPCIAITMPGEQESVQYVGSEPGADFDTDSETLVPSAYVEEGTFFEEQVAQFAGSVDAAIYAVNATEAVWLASLVKWAMLRARTRLEEAGLVEQKITTSDFMPASEYPQPDVAYTRVVKVAYTDFTFYTLESEDEDDTQFGSEFAVNMEND